MNGQQFAPIPYHETFGYDAFSNLTARQSDLWNGIFSDTDSASYTDTRRSGWGYDADGRNTTIDTRTYTFDAVGRQISMIADEVLPNGTRNLVSQTSGYDADWGHVQVEVKKSRIAGRKFADDWRRISEPEFVLHLHRRLC